MPRKSKYTINLNVRQGHEGYETLTKCESPWGLKALQEEEQALLQLQMGISGKNSSSSSNSHAAAPPTLTVAQQNSLIAKRQSKAMALAAKPGQAILMNALMMYMSGRELNVFSISVTSTAIMAPLTSLWRMQATFDPLEDNGSSSSSNKSTKKSNLLLPKLLFIALNLVGLFIGLYKMNSMQLLPMTSADWKHKIVWKEMMESTSIPPDHMLV